jgi:hypothetical protein
VLQCAATVTVTRRDSDWSAKTISNADYDAAELSMLKVEQGAHQLVDSPEVRPYVRPLVAVVTGADASPRRIVLF